jgi:hypothetical protein
MPKWPPSWNPFEVFILVLAIPASYPLLHAKSGSSVLDDRLSPQMIVLWGICLGLGCVLALYGVWCYHSHKRLVQGLWFESGGLALVGLASLIYAFVVFHTAHDVEGVTRAVATQSGFAAACFLRSFQGYRALWQTRKVYLLLQRMSHRPERGDGS